MKTSTLKVALALALSVDLLLVPVLVNSYLGFRYLQTLAHWKSKIIPPNNVYIGDSITAGGRTFNSFSDINLGINGLLTFQIAGLLKQAREYAPKHITVMAGTNDAISAPDDDAQLRKAWADICADPRIVVMLPPQTRSPKLNDRLDKIRSITRSVCEPEGRPIISLDALTGSDGLIKPEYTVDGVHLTAAGYDIWRAKLRELGI